MRWDFEVNIPNTAVEAAARAQYEWNYGGSWYGISNYRKEEQRVSSRIALEAAYTRIAAQVLRDTADALIEGRRPEGVSMWQWLRERAKQIEEPAEYQVIQINPLSVRDRLGVVDGVIAETTSRTVQQIADDDTDD